MSSNPDVFVILAAYNSADTLQESIDSVLAQSYSALHLVVVDDGSTDNTSQIMDDVLASDPRVHLIKKANSGAGDSRNKAIEYALNQGAEYIAFCDADDVWVETKLELQMQLMLSQKNVDVVVTDMVHYKPDQSPKIEASFQITHLANVFETLCTRNFTFQPVTALVRAKLFKEFSPYTRHKSGQDFYPYFRLAFEGCQFYKIELPLYRERQLTGSLQRSEHSAYLSGQARVDTIDRIQSEFIHSPLLTTEKQKLLNIARDRYCSWMLAGARKSMPYRQQLSLVLRNLRYFDSAQLGLRELLKCLFYPFVFKIISVCSPSHAK